MSARETAQVQPANSIVWDTKNIHYQTKKVETATNVFPGRLVKKGTNDDDIVVNTVSGAALGWAGYEQTAKRWRPATKATIYLASAQICVVNGPGIGVLGKLASGQNVAKGVRLMADADGLLSGGAVGTDEIVAIAEESIDASAGNLDIMVRSLI